jgi:hypothetical protein
MVDFILHVGDGKCGSTSIQDALYRARGDLAERGLIYETATPRSGHFSIVRLIGEQTRGDDAEQMKLAQMTLERIQAQLVRNSRVLLSAENLFSLDPERVMDICRMISPDISGIKVIAYVRPPVSMYLSLMQQVLKADHTFVLPQGYQRPIDKFLKSWRRSVGADNISIGVFEKAKLHGNNVVPDFARRLSTLCGINTDLKASKTNTSLTAEQLATVQFMRAKYFSDTPGKRRPESDALVQLFLQLNAIQRLGTPLELSDLARKVVSAKNREIVRQVRPLLQNGADFGNILPAPRIPVPDIFRRDDIRTILTSCDNRLVALLYEIVVAPLRQPMSDDAAAQRQAMVALAEDYGVDMLRAKPHFAAYFEKVGDLPTHLDHFD